MLGVLRAADFPAEFLLSCTTCYFQMLKDDGIWRALPPKRASYFQEFMREYQTVREAEGRGSNNPQYYLELPYRDISGHNQEQWAIRSRSYDFLERKILPAVESRVARSLNILDLGAGNGWMSYRLSLRGHFPVAVDLLASELDGLAASAHYHKQLRRAFPLFQAELNRLPFGDSQFDVAIFNASFHYSENYADTLSEAVRCLRPGGSVIIADTDWYKHDDSGQRMLAERQQFFTKRYGFPSDAITSLEYLTDRRLAALEEQFDIRWRNYAPFYGLRWAMRPMMAKWKGTREPSQFRIYVAEVAK
jgi:SAM-dependent methyltransferase